LIEIGLAPSESWLLPFGSTRFSLETNVSLNETRLFLEETVVFTEEAGGCLKEIGMFLMETGLIPDEACPILNDDGLLALSHSCPT
jgi:hypothetical protein